MFKDLFSIYSKEKELKSVALAPIVEDKRVAIPNKSENNDFYTMSVDTEKSISWNLYENLVNSNPSSGYFKTQFDMSIDKITLKQTFKEESNIFKSVKFISTQFFNTKFAVKKKQANGKEKLIQNHPLANLLNFPKESSSAAFWSVLIIDLIITGEAFFYLNKEENKLVYFQSELVKLKPNNIDLSKNSNAFNYDFVVTTVINGKRIEQIYTQEDMVHIKLPNPFNKFTGLSDIIAGLIPILTDKYVHEYIMAFFIRGGKIPKIYQSSSSDPTQNLRFIKSLQSAYGGRNNQFSDIIIPKGTEIADQGTNFQQIQLNDLIKNSRLDVYSMLGVPSALLGDTDGVNYANSLQQMNGFWNNRILPLQKMICSSLTQSYCLVNYFKIDASQCDLFIDNDGNKYLDEYSQRIQEDKFLAPILTINERREKIGHEPLKGSDGDKLESEFINSFQAFYSADPATEAVPSTPEGKRLLISGIKKKNKLTRRYEKFNQIPGNIKDLFQKEFSKWEDIILSNVNDQEKAQSQIEKRGEKFSGKFSKAMSGYTQKMYNFQLSNVINNKSNFITVTKQTQEEIKAKLDALAKRAKDVMAGKILDRSQTSFEGYSANETKRVYNVISELLKEDTSVDVIAQKIREKFGEFYEGQAETIVRTEYLSSQAYAYQQFNEDIKTVADKMEKQWVSINDEHTRPDHLELDNEIVEFDDSEEDPTFSRGDLRYPRDENGEADEVINCRCHMVTRVKNWKED